MKASKIFTGTCHLGRILAAGMLFMVSAAKAQFLITSPTYTYTQDFGTSLISASGTNITSGSANLTGWSYDAALTGEINITAAAPTNTGGRYAYTQNGNSNRKIGSRPSSSTGTIRYGILFKNTSGQTIQSFSVSYTGYQLSQGGNTAAAINTLSVDYVVSTSSIAITAGGGTMIPALDFYQTQFVSTANTGSQGAGYPTTTGTGANSGCISVAASIPDNSYLLIRWTDADDPQNDPHLAIDDVEVVFFTNQTVTNNVACSLLPVELLDFQAHNNGTENTISWKAAQEERIGSYILERSDNGIDFTVLEHVRLSASSGTLNEYVLSDTLPGKEITYYRLSTLEKNGNRKFYQVISLESKATDWTGLAYQNAGDLIVQLRGDVPAGSRISLYDLSGKSLAEAIPGQDKEVIPVAHLANGIYNVRITSPDKAQNIKVAITNQ